MEHATTRLCSELHAGGFDCALVPATTQLATSERSAPYALVVLTIEGDRLKLDMTSSAVGSSSHVVLLGAESELAALMLQATEFLRAGLVPRAALAPPPRAKEPSAPPPASVRRHWLVDLGPAVLSNWGARDFLPVVSFAAGYSPSLRLSIRALADLPLAQAHFQTERGTADYRIGLGTLDVAYAVMQGAQARLALGLDAGAARVSSSGRPVAPLEPRDSARWTLVLGVGATGEVRLSRRLALIAQGRVLRLSPNPLVAILGDERRLGNPCLLLGLGVRVVDN